MPKYVLAYHQNAGTQGGMPEGEAEVAEMMAGWQAWFGSIGEALVDGGNPIAFAKTVATDGSVSDGAANGLTGYSIINADNIDAACEVAKGCPVLRNDGNVEVAETLDM
ncbi:MAG: hypothetical protein ACI9C1_001014 [Candidatus Aldehydirespiratoraceae bacterium]|jgi:hypothetical protein